ncbi:MAG TPA: ABC transporter permease [Phycisphaerae bacterium]|nr:ABC transporter permease [Phycisphaerae bacterium]
MQAWTIIVDSFREARDKKLFWVLLALSTVIALALACVGFDQNGWSLFFGLLKIESPVYRAGTPQAQQMLASIVSNVLVAMYIGWFGVIVCLLGTAGFFPTMLEGGAIEVVLSKPMSRLELFLAKYAGSLLFVLVQAAWFVGLTFLIIRIQLGVWLWPYLLAIPLLVALFSYLYCVCVLAAVWSRSALTALLVTMVFWFLVYSAGKIEEVYAMLEYNRAREAGIVEVDLSWEHRNALGKTAYVLNAVLPRTSDIPVILGHEIQAMSADELVLQAFQLEGQLKPQDHFNIEQEKKRLARISPLRSIGSSLAFEAVILLIAWWRFARKDF